MNEDLTAEQIESMVDAEECRQVDEYQQEQDCE